MTVTKEDPLPDELNATLLYASTHTKLLIQIVKGTIDSKKLAEQELQNRGLDKNGKWVGFDYER